MTETAPARSEVTFEDSNGRKRGLRYDFNALVEIEEKLGGRAFGQVAAQLGAGIVSFSDIRVIIMVGLNCFAEEHQEKKLKVTLARAGVVVQGVGVKQSIALLNEAIQVAFPDMSEEDEGGEEDDDEGK